MINKNFFLIWSGKFVSMIGDRFYTLVLSLWILDRYGSPLMMGTVLVASTLPAFLIGFFAGTYVDFKSKKLVMILTDMVRGLLILSIAYGEYTGLLNLEWILIVSILVSLLNAFFEPAIKSFIPLLVEEGELAKANGLDQLISGISNVVGPILGAFAIGTIGFLGGFIVNGISFVLSAFFEGFIQVKGDKNTSSKEIDFVANLTIGYKYVVSKKSLKGIMIIIGLLHFAYGSFTLILPFLARTLSENPMDLGILQGGLGFGLIIGSTVLNRAKNHKGSFNLLRVFTVTIAISFGTIAVLDMVGLKNLIPYALVVLIVGIIISNAATYWQLMLQVDTPEALRGRVFGLVATIANISIPISYAIVGILTEQMSYSTYLMGFSVLMLLCIFWLKKNNEGALVVQDE